MPGAPEYNHVQDLPATIPVFPLPAALLLPGGRLPLNIFEPRYLQMIDDAMSGERIIGMIQPRIEGMQENNGKDLYDVGCAGRIKSYSETDDGRYLITLAGICRFRVREELSVTTLYRRVVPEFGDFERDLHLHQGIRMDEDSGVDRERLLDAVRSFMEKNHLSFDWDAIEKAPTEPLVTSLCMIAPFGVQEKQALLEAESVQLRSEILTTLIEMAVRENTDPSEGPMQ